MTLLSDATDAFGFGFLLIASVSIPSVGLIVSGVTLRKRGLNPWCGLATVAFFIALLIGSITRALVSNGGVGKTAGFWMLLGCCALHGLSALMALVGLAQVRRRRKWAHGKRRGYWTFWLNVLVIFFVGFWCYAHVNQELYNRLLRGTP